MILFKKAAELGDFVLQKKQAGSIIGFVPTMGALHKGHISLVERAKASGCLVVCSIFVNPTQFNDKKDFEKYPSTPEKDIDMMEGSGCDVLFLPGLDEMYPGGTAATRHFRLGNLEKVMEGRYRPGHFQGVCQVVIRLLCIVHPDTLFLGQKDYQQCLVLKKLMETEHLATVICIVPTLRENDGLAMSSRNLRLNESQRIRAVMISETLSYIKKEIRPGYLEDLKERAVQFLTAEGFKVDYVEIADADTLEPLENWDGQTPLVALVAAALDDVRLIDNMLI